MGQAGAGDQQVRGIGMVDRAAAARPSARSIASPSRCSAKCGEATTCRECLAAQVRASSSTPVRRDAQRLAHRAPPLRARRRLSNWTSERITSRSPTSPSTRRGQPPWVGRLQARRQQRIGQVLIADRAQEARHRQRPDRGGARVRRGRVRPAVDHRMRDFDARSASHWQAPGRPCREQRQDAAAASASSRRIEVDRRGQLAFEAGDNTRLISSRSRQRTTSEEAPNTSCASDRIGGEGRRRSLRTARASSGSALAGLARWRCAVPPVWLRARRRPRR